MAAAPKDVRPAEILTGCAVAIVFAVDLGTESNPHGGKFWVHPHMEKVEPDDPVLMSYLSAIYRKPDSVGAKSPVSVSFAEIEIPDRVEAATRDIAEQLSEKMARKNAKRGIVFGFSVRLSDDSTSFGVVKVDLDQAQRFHFEETGSGDWSLNEVSDMLPSPKRTYAKYAISPQPGGADELGVDDKTRKGSGADYFVEALGITLVKTEETKLAVANEAIRNGLTIGQIQPKLTEIREDMETQDAVDLVMPELPEETRAAISEKLAGPASKPMPTVKASDSVIRVYKCDEPHMLIEVADGVILKKVGQRRFEVELPAGSEVKEVFKRGQGR